MATDDLSIDTLPLPAEVRTVLAKGGITRLYPPQAEALGPALDGKSLVLACPTASGKSLVGYLALVQAALKKRRGLYIVPLRALASEKYQDLKAFEGLKIKVGLTMGEHDISSSDLDKVDILVATSEKTDSLLRHRSPWMEQLSVVVADEVHLMREPTRGPTLEVTLTRLKRHRAGLQVIALSATVSNSADLARWLKAVHVASTFRPVDLRYGIYRDGLVTFVDGAEKTIVPPGDPVERLVRSVIQEGGQALVFVNTRRSSESLAEHLGEVVEEQLQIEQRERLRELSQRLVSSGEEVTGASRKLSALVARGTAYHNASLTNGERGIIERAFKQGLIKVLTATPTLAAGVNLPARRVIVRDLTRYEDHLGMNAPLPVFEVHQMCGRAGRPGLDPYGEALLLAKGESDEEDLRERYLLARPERIESKLAAENVLRMHLLALVASQEVSRESELEAFLRDTFYGQEFEVEEIRRHINLAQDFLVRHGLLFGGELKATPFGKLASDLYLDPVTAVLMRTALRRAGSQTTHFSYLAAVAATPDIAPLYLRREDEAPIMNRYMDEQKTFLIKPGEEAMDLDLEAYLSTLKTAILLEAWIDDSQRLSAITDRFGIGAGDLHSRVERAEWLLSSMAQIARRERRELAGTLDELSIRVRYGVTSELLDLVTLREVGRVRGRALYSAGIRSRDELRKASASAVETALGSPVLAREVLAQVRPRPRPEHPLPQRKQSHL